MLPSEVLKLPPTPPVRGRPSVQELFLLHNSLPGAQAPSATALSPFLFLSFALPYSEEIGLPF